MNNDDQNTQAKLNQDTLGEISENQSVSANPTSSFNPSGALTPTQVIDPGAAVTSNSDEGKKGNKKVIATVLGILLLIGAVATGVFLVSSEQEIRIGAWDCQNYVFEVNQQGAVSARNGSTRNEPLQQAKVYINGALVATLDVPALDAGDATTIGTVSVPASGFSWEVIGTKDCEDSGRFDPQPTPTPTTIPTPTPTPTGIPSPTPIPTPTPSPTPPPIGASCLDVVAYDTDWNQLSISDLAVLGEGDVVRFAVAGSTTSGFFDKAQFTINGVLRSEVTAQKPGSNEFYDEYTVPAGVTSFTVNAQIHHSSLGWF